jgi:transposase
LAGLPLPEEEKAIVGRLVDELGRNSDQLAKLDMTIIREALANPRVVRLMTIPGIGPIVASTVLASIGDISRFETPEKLSCYFGLTPKVRQSGDRPARHGRISKQGKTHARKMLVEAAWSAKTAPGPLIRSRGQIEDPNRRWPNGYHSEVEVCLARMGRRPQRI